MVLVLAKIPKDEIIDYITNSKGFMVIFLSKINVAERQLETAIRLYFLNDDPVSIHTLSASAYGVLRDMALARNIPLLTAEQRLIERAVPGKERELLAALRRHQNFFKHADRDAGSNIDFNPDSTECLLFDGVASYVQLTGKITPVMGAFSLWCEYQNRGIMKPEYSDYRNALEECSEVFSDGRQSYFSKVYPIIQQKLNN